MGAGHLRPVAEAVAVLARPVAQVQAHGGAAVLDAQRGEAARPRVHRALEREVRVQLALHVACRQARTKLLCPIKGDVNALSPVKSRNPSLRVHLLPTMSVGVLSCVRGDLCARQQEVQSKAHCTLAPALARLGSSA